jgi:hypothetical protein
MKGLHRLAIIVLPVALGCTLATSSLSPTAMPSGTPTHSPVLTATETETIEPISTQTPSATATGTKTPTATISPTFEPAEGYFELFTDYDAQSNPDATIDLDTMEIRDDSTSDLILKISIGSEMWNLVDFLHGAKGTDLGRGDFTLASCEEVESSFTDYEIWSIFVGKNICVRTNRGRMVLLTVAAVTFPSGRSNKVRFHYVM